MLGIDALVFFDDDVAIAAGDVKAGHLALPAFGHEFDHAAFALELEVVAVEEVRQDRLGRHADSLQQDRPGPLAATVDTAEPHDFRARSEEHTSELQPLLLNSYAH